MITQIKEKITQMSLRGPRAKRGGRSNLLKRLLRFVPFGDFARNDEKEIVGVDISEDQITVVETTKSTYAVEVGIKDFVVKEISATQTDDEISNIIEEIFSEKDFFKKEVWLNIDFPEPSINFRRLTLPVMPAHEMPNAIKWNLKDKISLDVKNTELAYEIIGEFQKEDGSKNSNIMAVLIEKGIINKFLNIFQKAGITLTGINVTPFSISSILGIDKNLVRIEEPVAVSSIGKRYSYICMYIKGKLDFVRHIPLGLTSFLNAMTGVLVSDKGRIELTLEDARKIIEEFGIPKETDTILGGKVMPTQIIAMVRPVIERFAGEASRSIDYYQREFGTKRIEKILLTGEGSYSKGLSDFVSKELNIKVEYLKLPEGLKDAAAFGAAVGYKDSAINLLPEELRQRKKEEAKKTVLRVSTIGILSMLFFSFLSISIQIAGYKKQLTLIYNQKLILKDLKEMQDKINSRQAIVSCVREKETPVDLVLKELSMITPGNIAFLELWLNQKQKQLKLRGKVSIRPEAVQAILSDYMEELEKSSLFKEANLTNVQRETSSNTDTSVFEITCTLK